MSFPTIPTPPPEPSEDTGPTTEHEAFDEEEHPVIDPEGRPFVAHASMEDLHTGIDMDSETPEEAHREDHPTPDRPHGRIVP